MARRSAGGPANADAHAHVSRKVESSRYLAGILLRILKSKLTFTIAENERQIVASHVHQLL